MPDNRPPTSFDTTIRMGTDWPEPGDIRWDGRSLSRRRFLALATTAVGFVAIGCPAADPVEETAAPASPDRLRARPRDPSAAPVSGASPDSVSAAGRTGLHPLRIGSGRDGVVYIPSSLPPGAPAPLLVLLHGAGGRATNFFGNWTAHAEATRMVIAAPDSREATWRMGMRGGGRDAQFVDRMLQSVWDRVRVDPARIALAGWSDGASYALTLGLANGDLFSRVVAFSPGFLAAAPPQGRPRVFVSHGTNDTILPIDRCSRVIVPLLRRSGYDVEYVEFEGGHEVPTDIRERALRWLAW